MKCPTCLAPCLDGDTWCLSCRTPMVAQRGAKHKSAIWLCAPLFLVLGTGLFLALADVAPQTRNGGVNWDQMAQIGMVSIASGVFGAAVGWVLDFLARRR